MDVANVKTLELQQEGLELRRRVKKLNALLRLALALLRSSGGCSGSTPFPQVVTPNTVSPKPMTVA
jgi:hypothetical protein